MSSQIKLGESRVGKVGIIYLGGCGNNVLRQLLQDISPEDYPDFYHFGANTDVMATKDKFGDGNDENKSVLEPWIRAKMLFQQPLGTPETYGYGAGALPEVGRKATEAPEVLETFRAFMDPLSEIIILGGASGGTAGGGLPVVARLAKEMGKNTMAIVVMPRRGERRDAQAKKVLAEVQSLVQTLPIHNRYIEEYMHTLPEEKLRTFDFEDGWKMVNQYSVIQSIQIYREIIQVPGDIKNLDQADKKTAYSMGNHVFLGVAGYDEGQALGIEVKDVVSELLTGRCQDPEGYKNGESMIMWVHGPWPMNTILQVEELLCRKVFGENWVEDEVPRFHWGMRRKVEDGRMFIAILVISKRSAGELSEPLAFKQLERKASIPARTERVITDIAVDGLTRTMRVWKDQASRYKEYWPNPTSPAEEVLKLREEIRESHGIVIDLPSWMKQDGAECEPRSNFTQLPNVH